MVLSCHMIDAHQVERDGLVSRVVPSDQLVDEALKIANKIASAPRIAVKMGKEAVNVGYEQSLQEGLKFESLLFWSSFATKDQKEGMMAYMEKRMPNFTHQ
ncbi:hypothetical protein Poli38472_008323 [Pythium oligandrum]|uniref:Enoyl-CoA hydratase domain-containing protein 3, mitochondrial n=1 Tax=Pythium oligandrum TaxID=41045 RepID=A0A8K1CN51_PYTOL|nr:hypothetical protein Poli38472_008323 [Pythium oligandrum]|eukprot:TMW65681.1 hypothetical protein Poli38472_008323 [Pythium oligandrum]